MVIVVIMEVITMEVITMLLLIPGTEIILTITETHLILSAITRQRVIMVTGHQIPTGHRPAPVTGHRPAPVTGHRPALATGHRPAPATGHRPAPAIEPHQVL